MEIMISKVIIIDFILIILLGEIEALKEELRKAEEYIFMEYFIVEKGIMWNEILDILKAKVWQGVDVRFMYDGMCSMQNVPYAQTSHPAHALQQFPYNHPRFPEHTGHRVQPP